MVRSKWSPYLGFKRQNPNKHGWQPWARYAQWVTPVRSIGKRKNSFIVELVKSVIEDAIQIGVSNANMTDDFAMSPSQFAFSMPTQVPFKDVIVI